ncbi:MAG: hypothetical protein ABEI77_05945 [Halorientalis sp.]
MGESETDPSADTELPGPEAYADGTLVRDAEVEKPLGQDDFDPKGTLALLLMYFLILTLMWTYMYFVEFLGNGPTVIG